MKIIQKIFFSSWFCFSLWLTNGEMFSFWTEKNEWFWGESRNFPGADKCLENSINPNSHDKKTSLSQKSTNLRKNCIHFLSYFLSSNFRKLSITKINLNMQQIFWSFLSEKILFVFVLFTENSNWFFSFKYPSEWSLNQLEFFTLLSYKQIYIEYLWLSCPNIEILIKK